MPDERSQKQANLERQQARIEEGNRKHAQMESQIYSEAGEAFSRKFFNMTTTERQMYGLKMKKGGFVHPPGYVFEKKPSYISKCCRRKATLRKSISYGPNKREDIYRCGGCWRDCEVTIRAPRKKK